MVEIQLHNGKEDVLVRYDGEMNWELCAKANRQVYEQDEKGKKVGTGEYEEYWKPFGWFANPAMAFNKVAQMKVGNSNARSLKELSAKIDEVHQELLKAYNKEFIDNGK